MVTRTRSGNYQRRLKNAAVIDEEEDLLTRLKQYMNRYRSRITFPVREASPGSSGHLETKIHLRAIERDNSENRAA